MYFFFFCIDIIFDHNYDLLTWLQSRMIGDAAYQAKWYNSGTMQSRFLFLLILRSQRKLTITIGKFMDLSLERFTTVRYIPKIMFSFIFW